MTAAEVHVEVAGRHDLSADAPTVVLSNSLGADLTMWDAQVDALSQSCRVVRYDTRGHGDSTSVDGPCTIDDLADDVIAMLDRLGIERVHFAGLSLGGMTGLRLAARDPERIDRLAVLCTSAYLPPAQAWRDRAATVRREGAGAVAESVVARWYTPAFAAGHSSRVAQARQMVGSTDASAYAACCEAIAAMDLREDLARVTVPTLAIAGQDDPATPPSHLELIARTVLDGRLLVVPSAAHLANDEQPEIVALALLKHFALTTNVGG